MPALAEAAKLGAKAQKSGFDWPSWRELLPKVAEETAELVAEAESDETESNMLARKAAVEAELGDLLFTVVNLGRHLGVDAEMALAQLQSALPPALQRNGTLQLRGRSKNFRRRTGSALGAGEKEAGRREVLELGDLAQDKSVHEETRPRCDAQTDRKRSANRIANMIEIRSCEGFDEMQACVQLQIEIWGYDESDVTPRKTFMLAQKIGGQVIGAFDSESGAESGSKTGGFRHVFAGDQANPKRPSALSPLAHAGGPAVPPQSRPWRATQMGTTT